MAYTAPTLRVNANPPRSNFGGLVVDGNRNAMTGVLGSYMQTIDAADSPVTSPATVNTTATLKVPTNAAQCTIISVTNAVQVSEDSTETAYFSLPAGIPWTFDCSRMSNIYLKTGSSTVVSFYFNMV